MKFTFVPLRVYVALAIAAPLSITAASPVTEKARENPKPYSLEVCIVSGDKLGEMGKPVVFVYKGQEIKLCCKPCRKDFDMDPAKYLKKLK
jgi:YHS domain-containing protein